MWSFQEISKEAVKKFRTYSFQYLEKTNIIFIHHGGCINFSTMFECIIWMYELKSIRIDYNIYR